MEDSSFTEQLIDEFINTSGNYNGTDEKSILCKERLRQKFFEDVKNEITELERENIIKKVKEELEEEEHIKELGRLKIFIVESLILGFIVGLIVNQTTDFLSYYKGCIEKNIIGKTFGIVIILALILILFIFLVYSNKLENLYLNWYMKRKEKN